MVKVPVEVAVEVASSSLLFASFSKRILDYASSQHGTNQFIINKKIQHFFVRGASSLLNGNHFLVRIIGVLFISQVKQGIKALIKDDCMNMTKCSETS